MVQGVQDAKRLRHFERTIVRQEDAAGADANAGCLEPHPGEQNFGRRAGEAKRGMVFGDPVPLVAEPISQPGQVDRVAQGVGGLAQAGTGD